MKSDLMQISTIMMIHFGPCKDDATETCGDCRDFISGSCPGENRKGRECWDCMAEKFRSGQFMMGGSF